MYDFKKIVRKKNSVNFWNIHFSKENQVNFDLIQRRNYRKDDPVRKEENQLNILHQMNKESLENHGISDLLGKLFDFKSKT